MIIKCAWCGKDMGEKPPYEDKSITHSICEECLAKYFPEKGGGRMPVSEKCLWEFRAVFDAARWAHVARESIRLGFTESAIQAINWAEYHLENMKGTPEYDKAQDLLSKARAARMTDPDLAIGYLNDIEPLIEQGALQKVVACECKGER